MRTCRSLVTIVASRPSSGTIGPTLGSGSCDGIDGRIDVAAAEGGEGRVFGTEGAAARDETVASSGSTRRATRFATMRSAGRLTAIDERTPSVPKAVLRT